jgi:DNA-directed RNA polymerase subunit RPC12/RpoP
MEYIDLTTVNDVFEAQILGRALQEENIPCIEANENIATILPHLQQGIRIRVRATDYLRARVIADKVEEMRLLRCPQCESNKVVYKGSEDRELNFREIIKRKLRFPVKAFFLVYSCSDCGTTFKTN